MKKLVLFFAAALALASCTEEIQRNEQALVGVKNGQNWRAGGAYANISTSGELTVTGVYQFETLELQLPSATPGTYQLGNSEARRAVFIDENTGVEKIFSTGTGRGDGEIVIQEYNEAARTITGTFKFNAIDEEALDPTAPDSTEVMNFIYGNFYRIPVTPAP